jgi:NAD+ diphosphatase
MSKIAFISSPLDRNANNRANVDFVAGRRADPTSKILQLAGDAVRLDNDKLYTANDAPNLEAIYLGEDDESLAWFARSIAPDEALKPIRTLMVEHTLSRAKLSILAQARSILHWHESHKFCAKCGSQSLMADAGYRRHCEACGADHFPRTDPVVIMAVRHGEKLLLGRQASWPPGMYSSLAGFMEPGEPIEAAVRREVLEESGIKVGAVHYVTSQPWPYPSSLMIGMIGEAETTELKIDKAELEDARWFEKAEVELMLTGKHPEGFTASHPYAIAHHLINAALERK